MDIKRKEAVLKWFVVVWLIPCLIVIGFGLPQFFRAVWNDGLHSGQVIWMGIAWALFLAPAVYAYGWKNNLYAAQLKTDDSQKTKLLKLMGLAIAAVGFAYFSWQLPKPQAQEEASAITEAAVLSGKIDCHTKTNYVITTVSKNCENFVPPARVAINEKFSAEGREYTIRYIDAFQVDRDTENAQLGIRLRKGQWMCSASQEKKDLGGKNKGSSLWLSLMDCAPSP